MVNYLQQLGILLQSSGKHTKRIKILVVKNTDGSPRWICNAESTKALFLKFYLVTSVRSRLFALAINLVFFFRLHKIVFDIVQAYVSDDKQSNIANIDYSKTNWAIFTGTIGPNNKTLIYEHGDKNFFYKVSFSEQAIKLLDKEEDMMSVIEELNPKKFTFPEFGRINNNVLILQDLSPGGKRCSDFTKMHIDTLNELYSHNHTTDTLSSSTIIKNAVSQLKELKSSKDKRLPIGLINKLQKLYDSIENTKADFSLAHGDFCPWNMYVKNDKLAIYDWELSCNNMPIGFDAFHFIIQQGILVEHINWNQIKEKIINVIPVSEFNKWTNNGDLSYYLKVYLLINTTNYLHIYSQQKDWHMQVQWLLNTWSTAISDMISDIAPQRESMILDFFEFMHNKEYAALKFPNKAPQKLSLMSDIDVVIKEDDAKEIIDFLKNHPLTLKFNLTPKSFMAACQIIIKDGTILCIDLIWQLKRRSIQILNTYPIINRSYINEYNVHQISDIDQLRYVGLFYALNGALVPQKYKTNESLLKKTDDNLDKELYNYIFKNTDNARILASIVNNSSPNKLSNSINYRLDILREYKYNKGMIITFSGVDGAGKSTIIENVKNLIEKKVRRNVVVIRHRPSLLPILSAWTKGKAKAEQDAANTLPRQGGNKSSIGSLVRFSYYYLDYIIGQFYVQLKYVMRGQIVLYDRYYFDFINDSKRSNIQLPKAITTAGYYPLLKPNLNFFLYADPEIILARKRELDADTIRQLTSDYLSLFEKLGKSSQNRYFPIQNIDLQTSLDYIMSQVVAKL